MKKIVFFSALVAMLTTTISCGEKSSQVQAMTALVSDRLDAYSVIECHHVGIVWQGVAMKVDAYNNNAISFTSYVEPKAGFLYDFTLQPTESGFEYILE